MKLDRKRCRVLMPLDQYTGNKPDDRYLIPFMEWGKIGFMNQAEEIVMPPKYDIYLDEFYRESSLVRVGETYGVGHERKTMAPSVYLYKRYGLLNSKGEFVLPMEYDGILMPLSSAALFVVRIIGKGYAVVNADNEVVVPFGKYNYIDGFDQGYARVKLGTTTNGLKDSGSLWGIINEQGEEVLEPKYSNIWNFYDKSRFDTRVEEDGKVYEFDLSRGKLFPDGHRKALGADMEREMENDHLLQKYRERTYDEYAGTYAQDEMGLSDQDIDDAFDGDPDACWNID